MTGRIEKAELYVVKLPLVSPFVTAAGSEEHRESLLLKITAGGISGWSECAAFRTPWYHCETIDTALHISATFLLPELMKKASEVTPEDVAGLFSQVQGHRMAKAMIENAVFDLHSRKYGVPLYQALGGARKRIRSGISIGITDGVDQLMTQVDSAVKKKYHKIKIKIRKGWDIHVVTEVRSAFPWINLTADANGAYSGEDLATLRMLDKFDLKMIEQPFGPDHLLEHASLQEELSTPVCLDESITGYKAAENAVSLRSCRMICIKQGRVGGLLESLKIKDLCMKQRMMVWCGGMLETGIGRAFNLHLQTVPGFEFPGDVSETSRYFHEDIVREPVVLDRDGYIDLPQGNGIGVEVDENKVEDSLIFKKKMVG